MARPIPKNRKPRYCPECRGSMVKRGKKPNGKQIWICRECGRTSVKPNKE